MIEQHYRMGKLAELWSCSRNTIKKLFKDEPGVVRIEGSGLNGKVYVCLLIPESVVIRVHERLSRPTLHVQLPTAKPLRAIRLRDLPGGLPPKPRKIIRLKNTPPKKSEPNPTDGDSSKPD